MSIQEPVSGSDPGAASSLSDLKNRSKKVVGRGQILTILQANSCSIGQKGGEIWTGQTLLQPISFKSDRLLRLIQRFSGFYAGNDAEVAKGRMYLDVMKSGLFQHSGQFGA